jgi:hypothetical protein
MNASAINNRINGLPQTTSADNISLARAIAAEILRETSRQVDPLIDLIGRLLSATIGGARTSAGSMLFPLIAMGGLLSSDLVNNPASSYNKGETLVEKAQALDQRRNDLSSQAKALVELDSKNGTSINKRVPPKAKQFTVEDGLGATTLEKNERTADRQNVQIQKIKMKAKANAERVISMTSEMSKEGQAKLAGLKEAKNNSQVAYNALLKSQGANHTDTITAQRQLQTATRREQLIQAIIRKSPDTVGFDKIDHDVNTIIQLEEKVSADKKLADSRYRFNGHKIQADNIRVNQNMEKIDELLKNYGLSRSLLAV